MVAGSLRQSHKTNGFSNLCRLSVGTIECALSLVQAVEWMKNAAWWHRIDQISTQNSGSNRAVEKKSSEVSMYQYVQKKNKFALPV